MFRRPNTTSLFGNRTHVILIAAILGLVCFHFMNRDTSLQRLKKQRDLAEQFQRLAAEQQEERERRRTIAPSRRPTSSSSQKKKERAYVKPVFEETSPPILEETPAPVTVPPTPAPPTEAPYFPRGLLPGTHVIVVLVPTASVPANHMDTRNEISSPGGADPTCSRLDIVVVACGSRTCAPRSGTPPFHC